MVSEEKILSILQSVKDPEIPTISIVDLGMVDSVSIESDQITINIVPTFVGCPAVDYIKQNITSELQHHGIYNLTIEVLYNKLWSSESVTEQGKKQIEQHGIAFEYQTQPVTCPVCHSEKTVHLSPFGPTLCRSIYKCLTCHETFESFKNV